MKRIVTVLLLGVLFMSCFSINSFATEASDANNSERTTGLINVYTISITKSGTCLTIKGRTTCTSEVTKCGFKTLTVEYRANSNADWDVYEEYIKLYDEDNSYNLEKTITIDSGYQYRVVCEHYAYKNLFQTETIDNISNTAY